RQAHPEIHPLRSDWLQRNRIADCWRTDEVGLGHSIRIGSRKRAAAPTNIAAIATANPPNHTQGVPFRMRSRVSFCAGVTKNDVPCCFTSMLYAGVCAGEDSR